ncbi:MAG: 30S ribosomal protein S1 [Deltaproteobacteria bacterium]|nr:30S ribosomal protein S1 [Deltaproteobacteria bacterium]
MSDHEESFEALLEQSLAERPIGRQPRLGEKITGMVVSISSEWVIVDLGAKTEGVIEAAELMDDEGQLTVKVGDELDAFVSAVDDGVRLSRRVRPESGSDEALRQIFEAGLPVEGVVTGVNKGGLEVKVAGKRAFCQISQIQLDYCEDPSVYVGQKLEFRILKMSGRDILVSRRVLLEAERAEAAAGLWERLEPGQILEGEVSRIAAFGAFVNLGGVDGLIHVSELSHERIEDPGSLLKVGQAVKVQVVTVDREAERIGLSLKALEADPWDSVVEQLPPGLELQGTVTRLQPFGAFVALGGGMEGLVHVSELSDRRINHPKEVVEEGQRVDVRVIEVDPERRRIALSMREARQAPGALPRVGDTFTAVVDRIESYGLLVKFAGHRGLVPGKELPGDRSSKRSLEEVYPVGAELEVAVIEVDESKGRIRLSVNELERAKDRAEWQTFQQKQGGGSFGTSLGDLLAKRGKK